MIEAFTELTDWQLKLALIIEEEYPELLKEAQELIARGDDLSPEFVSKIRRITQMDLVSALRIRQALRFVLTP